MRKYIIVKINSSIKDPKEEGLMVYNCLVRFMKPAGKEHFAPTFFLNIKAKEGLIDEAKFVDDTIDKKFIYGKNNLANSDKCVISNVIFDVSTYRKGNSSQVTLSTADFTTGLKADKSKRNKEINEKIQEYKKSLNPDIPTKLKVMRKDYHTIEGKLAKANRKIDEQKETIKAERKELTSLRAKIANLERSVANLKELQKSKTEFSKGRDYVLNQLGLDL